MFRRTVAVCGSPAYLQLAISSVVTDDFLVLLDCSYPHVSGTAKLLRVSAILLIFPMLGIKKVSPGSRFLPTRRPRTLWVCNSAFYIAFNSANVFRHRPFSCFLHFPATFVHLKYVEIFLDCLSVQHLHRRHSNIWVWSVSVGQHNSNRVVFTQVTIRIDTVS